MYDVNYFIKKFEAIPEDKWTTGRFALGGQCCALGHCGERLRAETEESRALDRVVGEHGFVVITINDGSDLRFNQPTPKKRILAVLQYVKDHTL